MLQLSIFFFFLVEKLIIFSLFNFHVQSYALILDDQCKIRVWKNQKLYENISYQINK